MKRFGYLVPALVSLAIIFIVQGLTRAFGDLQGILMSLIVMGALNYFVGRVARFLIGRLLAQPVANAWLTWVVVFLFNLVMIVLRIVLRGPQYNLFVEQGILGLPSLLLFLGVDLRRTAAATDDRPKHPAIESIPGGRRASGESGQVVLRMSSSSRRWAWFCALLISVLVAIDAVRGVAFSPYEYQAAWFWVFVISFVMAIVALREAWWKSFPVKYKPWVWLSLFLISIAVGSFAMYEESIHEEPWDWFFLLVISFVVGIVAISCALVAFSRAQRGI